MSCAQGRGHGKEADGSSSDLRTTGSPCMGGFKNSTLAAGRTDHGKTVVEARSAGDGW